MSGTTLRPKKTSKKKATSVPQSQARSDDRVHASEKKTSDTKLYGGLGAVVAVLAVLVWWSLPGNHAAPPADDDPTSPGTTDDPDATQGERRKSERWDRPARATAEFAIVTDRPDDVVQKLATTSEIASRLEARATYCGNACDAVKKFIEDEDGFELEVMKTEDVILPPRDSMDTVAPGLTPSERDKVQSNPTSVMVRVQGAITPEQVPARAAFAAAAVLADALGGFVYDEVSRRIETAHDFGHHTITAKLGEPAFAPKQIVVQFYRQEDGTARLLTLGMQRYGSPDLALRGANMASGASLTSILNAAASQIAHGNNDPTIKITLDDVARVMRQTPAELNPSPASAKPVELDITSPERIEGDPDNELAELAPKGGASREGWDAVLTNLFGAPPSVEVPLNDKELDEVSKKARRDLPDAIKRFQNGYGELFVKGPFVIPSEARVDRGVTSELLWVAASSCDDHGCTGVLTNEPTHATNLAAGRITSIRRSEIADWMLQSRDGGTLGGESIKVLKARSRTR
jgi:uncharacterized protein YegJ (DUF2314 family)